MSEDGDANNADGEVESFEIETVSTDTNGNLVIDDVVSVTDQEGHVVARDEIIVVMDGSGDAVIDQVV
jgi:predicted RNA-binding protein